MSKWFGKIGLVQTVETEPSIFEEKVTEHDCYGELLKNTRRVQTGDKVNDDLTIANTLSILADPTLYKHFDSIKYAEIMGARWKVISLLLAATAARFPRTILWRRASCLCSSLHRI